MDRIEKVEKVTMSCPFSLSVVEPDQRKGNKDGQVGQYLPQTGQKASSSDEKLQKFGKKKRTGSVYDQKQTVPHQKSDDGDQNHAPPGLVRFQKSRRTHARRDNEQNPRRLCRAVKRPALFGSARFAVYAGVLPHAQNSPHALHAPEHQKADEKRPEHVLAVSVQSAGKEQVKGNFR